MAEKLQIRNFNSARIERLIVSEKASADTLELKSKIELLNNKLDLIINKGKVLSVNGDKINLDKELFVKDVLISCPIGMIMPFVGKVVPTGWLECNGQIIDEELYGRLYNLIGSNVPNLTGRFIVGSTKMTNSPQWDYKESYPDIYLDWYNIKRFDVEIKGKCANLYDVRAGNSNDNFEYLDANSISSTPRNITINNNRRHVGISYNEIIPRHYKIKHIIKAL